MAIVRALLWVFYLLLLAISIATIVLHAITERQDDRIDNTTTWFGIVAGILGFFVSLYGLALLASKNLHRRPVNTFQQWLNAFCCWFFSIATGMWILYENTARDQLRSYEHAAFALVLSGSVLWTLVTALWHWKSQEEYALGHK